MADQKISQLTALTGANTAADDQLAIVDTNVAETKKISRAEFFKNTPDIGIGTSSPLAPFHVYRAGTGSSIRIDTDSSTQTTQLNFAIAGTNRWSLYRPGSSNDLRLFDNTNTIDVMTWAASGNVGIGTSTPGATYKLDIVDSGNGDRGARITNSNSGISTTANFTANNGTSFSWFGQAGVNYTTYAQIRANGSGVYANGAGGIGFSADNAAGIITFGTGSTAPERMRIDSSGNLRIGLTAAAYNTERLTVFKSGNTEAAAFINNAGSANYTVAVSNRETTGDNKFIVFATEGGDVTRGSITYNRAGGLVAYNTTSDYRAKDIIGPITDSGSLIDSTPVYMGKMKDATQERPMFIAHEVPAYAHTGVKDAVDADGNPVYQQMDASALIPVMWAEIQSLRARLAAANI